MNRKIITLCSDDEEIEIKFIKSGTRGDYISSISDRYLVRDLEDAQPKNWVPVCFKSGKPMPVTECVKPCRECMLNDRCKMVEK
jgi:hypothetical protein